MLVGRGARKRAVSIGREGKENALCCVHTAMGGPRYSATNSDESRYFTITLFGVVNDLRVHDKRMKNIELVQN